MDLNAYIIQLVLLKGHPGTGKSTLAEALARRLRWPLVDKDDIKDHTEALPDGNVLAYRIMWQVAERQLMLGLSVIVDSPLSYAVGYETARDLAVRYGIRLLVVETRLDDAEWRARLDARPADYSTHKIRGANQIESLLATYQDSWRYPIAPDQHLIVDTAQPLPLLVDAVLARLHRVPAGPAGLDAKL
jgi:predicted kinase